MYTLAKHEMLNISAYAGTRKDYVQGGGGNTSVKLDDRLMAIKASGYTLQQITAEKGYVTVDYKKLLEYYETVDASKDKDFEKESLQVNLESVALLPEMENRRPSVEVGFHSLLKKCVIHTHSVYANILCCSSEGREIAAKALEGSGIGYVFIPYIDPGFRLTLAVKDAVWTFAKEHGAMPDAIFLDNHGLIVHGDSDEEAIAIHETVNRKIIEDLSVEAFPVPGLKKTGNGFLSDTAFLNNFVEKNKADEAYFNSLKIYPDQLVYIGGKIGTSVHIINDRFVYQDISETEAVTVEETLLGVAFVIDAISKAGLHFRQMDEKSANFINNWESEKYRSGLIK